MTKAFRRRLRVLKFQRAQEIITLELARVAKEKELNELLARTVNEAVPAGAGLREGREEGAGRV